MYYGMVKPLHVMSDNVLGKSGKASELGNIFNIMVKPLELIIILLEMGNLPLCYPPKKNP